MQPYKNYLIDHYSVQKPMQMGNIGTNDIPSTVLTTVWETRIIDLTTGKTMRVNSADEAKRLIDQWALMGDPATLLVREKELEEKKIALDALELETMAKIRELIAIKDKALDEFVQLLDSAPQRFE